MKEIRNHVSKFEVRSNQDGTRSVAGYAAVFNSLSKPLGNFREQIAQGAFTRTLQSSDSDVRLLYGHDWNQVLGRQSANTLQLREDAKGLYFSANLPDTTLGRDLAVSMERGDINSMSFGFQVEDDDWDQTSNGIVRTLRSVNLGEISIVSNPAYDATQVSLRSAPEAIRALLTPGEAFDESAALGLILAHRRRLLA